MLMMDRTQIKGLAMSAEVTMIKTEIELPGALLYSQGVYENRAEYFVKKNFLPELYRDGEVAFGRMVALLGMNRAEILGVMKDSDIPLNYGVHEL